MRENDERRAAMSSTKEMHWLEAELERSRHDLQEDLSHIEIKLHKTGARLRPATFIGDKALMLLGVSLALGFAIGYWDVPIGEIGKPVARTMLTTVGKQMVARAIKG